MARPALSASRAAAILALLTVRPKPIFTMAEIVCGTGINVGSCYAVLSAMVESGLLTRDEVFKSYGLGLAMVTSGQAAMESNPAVIDAQQAARDLADELGVAILLTTKLSHDQLVLGSFANRAGRMFDVTLGQRLALTPPLGAHLIAGASAVEVEKWIAQANPEEAVAAEWRSHLEMIRMRGYHVSLRDPDKPGFAEMLARMAGADPRVSFSQQTREVVNRFGWIFCCSKNLTMLTSTTFRRLLPSSSSTGIAVH